MRMRLGASLVGGFIRLAAGALLGLAGVGLASAQSPAPAPTAQPAKVAIIPPETHSASQVFPEGGFPDTPPAPEGGIPATGSKSGQGAEHPPIKPASADYAPQGYQGEAPGAVLYRPFATTPLGHDELYVPPPLPSPDYLLPAVGPHAYADYAPPGYEPREGEEGVAPGVMEFTPISAPVPLTPEELAKFGSGLRLC